MSRYSSGLVSVLRLRGPLASDSTARVFHALLVALVSWFGFATLITLPVSPITGVRIGAVTTAEVTLGTALLLLHIGRFRQASIVYLAGTWLFATVVMTFNGGIRSPVQVFFVTLPISAAWLLGYRAALWTSGIGLATALVFTVIEVEGTLPARLIPATPYGLWAVLVQATCIGAVPVAEVLRTLRQALTQSRRAERELDEYRQRLEELVDQRTGELVQARDEAQAANQAKNVFLANMSHELRTPLNAILGFTSLLRERGASEAQRRDLDIIHRSGEHLLGLLNDLLDVAKIEAGHTEIEIAACDLRSLVEDVAGMMRVRAEESNLMLHVIESLESAHRVRADAARLRQVLINLLGNAIKYTDRGSVTLRVHTSETAVAERLLLTFEVEDTGIGIAAEDQARIFDAFVQLGNPGLQKGTGLGLAITRRFVQLMGGTIRVESTPGRGSRFRVEVPVERAPELEVSVGPEWDRIVGLEPAQRDCRVLIVEDEQENRIVLERLLQNAGFLVRVAEDGARGVEMFRSWSPHFIWMDLRMPGMDGIEATRRIRALNGGREVKIAAVTASGVEGERKEVMAAGLDDYVRKPWRPNEIFECMARHLGIRYRRAAPSRAPSKSPDWAMRPERLAALPPGLVAELRDCVIALNIEGISRAVERIGTRDRALASVLAHYSERYAYSAILNAIESCREDSAGQGRS